MGKIRLGDREVEAEDIPFETKKEEWNEYILADGTLLKFKSVATNIFKTEVKDNEGNPVYALKSQNILSIVPLRKFEKRELQ